MNAKLFLFVSLFIISACGKPMSEDVAHNLAPSHNLDSPATVACNTAMARVQSALKTLGANSGATVSVVNPPAGCGVSVAVTSQDKVLPTLKTIKTKTGSYSSVSANGRLVGLWPSVVVAPPSKDKSAPLPAKTAPVTTALCNQAVGKAATSQPLATIRVFSSGGVAAFHAPCYLDMAFHDDVSFESFFSADNPYSATHDIFHIDFVDPTGATASVPMHVYRGLDVTN